uniref:Uncharacterized protein n=1 Tax=Oryza glumipatula TaxID=40148 RepID=A0A0E0BRA4_9ORYZ
MAIFLFSKAMLFLQGSLPHLSCNFKRAGQHRRGIRSLQKECQSVGFAIVVWEVMGYFVFGTLQANALEIVYHLLLKYRLVYHQHHVVTAEVSRHDDTTADVVRFSLVAALLHVIMQSFVCTMVLALYRETRNNNRHDIRRNDAAAHND